jgi:UDP-N-acetylmuramate dehydrogenase
VGVAIVGKGSNLLVADEGFAGIVLRLGRGYRWASRDGARLIAGAAMPLPALAGVALRHGLGGLEFGVAIPASTGGAVRMNAGAHEGTMADVVGEIELYRLDQGEVSQIPAAQAGFAYRRSDLPAGAMVTGAVLELHEEDIEAIRGRMEQARNWRRRTQPLAEPNCGSVFKNPPGDHAARLIEGAGAKGTRVGGAHVSDKHANFIIADAGTTARDVLGLIERVRSLVQERAGVVLEPEVQMIGVAPDATDAR